MQHPEGATQLAEQLREKIEQGTIAPGERLIPIRTMANAVGLNRNTVAAAYRRLHQAGLIEPSGRNMRVALRPFFSLSEVRREQDPELVDLSFNNPDPSLLPDLSHILGKLEVGHVQLYGDDPDSQDLLRCFETLHRDLKYPKGVGMIVPGTTEEMGRLLRMYHNPGDKVAVENPGYMKLIYLVRAYGLQAVPIALDQEGPRLDLVEAALKAGVKSVFFTPRAQNPCGITTSKQRAAALKKLLRDYPDILVVEDEHAGPLLDFSAQSCIDSDRAHWAVLHSVAKYLGPDLRVAAMFSSKKTHARAATQRELGGQWVSHLMQRIVYALLTAPDRKQLDAYARARYEERRQALEAALDNVGVSYVKGHGLNIWIETDNAERIAGRMYRKGWSLRTGSEFCLGAINGLRITISQLSVEACVKLASDLAELLPSKQNKS